MICMKTEAVCRFIGSSSAVVRCAFEHNGDTVTFSMRVTTQILLYYLGDASSVTALLANPHVDAGLPGVNKT